MATPAARMTIVSNSGRGDGMPAIPNAAAAGPTTAATPSIESSVSRRQLGNGSGK
jgi:hypothetical protein